MDIAVNTVDQWKLAFAQIVFLNMVYIMPVKYNTVITQLYDTDNIKMFIVKRQQ